MKKMMSAIVAVFAVMACTANSEDFRKKIIACSWDFGTFTVADVLSNKAAIAALPVDGVMLSAVGPILPDGKPLNPKKGFSGTNEWPKGILAPLVPQFREATAIRSLRHSFTLFRLSRNKKNRLDFRDDAGWARAFANVRQLAVLARDGGLKGLVMDPEDYNNGEQFVRQENEPPYEEMVQLARRRGREFSQTVLSAYPDMILFTFWAFSQGRRYMAQLNPREEMRVSGELYIPFLDGVLDAIPPGVRIVDGDETSYNYSAYGGELMTYAEKICQNRSCIALVSPENREKFRAQVLFANALYLDRYTNKKGKRYYSGPLNGSRLLKFDENLNAALRAADEYTWLWCEKFAWIDWKIHGKPTQKIGFDKHRTWDDELPGIYDAIWSARSPNDFFDRRFPEIRNVGACTNLVSVEDMKVTGKAKHGRRVFVMPVRRGERYVVEFTAKGIAANAHVGFSKTEGKRLWGLRSLVARGEGSHRLLVKIGPETEFIKFSIGVDKSYGKEAQAVFSNIGCYRLPAPIELEDVGVSVIDGKADDEKKEEMRK